MANDNFLAFIGLLIWFSSCQPKADITTIDNPMNSFHPTTADSVRGAATIQDLACYFFISLKGDISFDKLATVIPDSADIAEIYRLTHTELKNANVKANADSVLHQLNREWVKTRSEASELKANWSNATFEQLLIQDMENQVLPSKIIKLKCRSGDVTLRASAKCMLIGDKWFIGEDIRFGT